MSDEEVMYDNPWIFSGKEFTTEDVEDYYGFVYLITNHKTNKKYIGKKFFQSHRTLPPLKGKKRKRKVVKSSNWKKYYGSCVDLIKDLEDYGYDTCTREILSLHKDKWDVNYSEVKEQFKYNVLEELDSNNNRIFYNSNILSRYFIRPEFTSDDTRRKMSNAQRGKILSEETKIKIGDSLRGKPKPPFTKEHKENISKSLLGRDAWNKDMVGVIEISEETKQKLSKSHKNLPADHPCVLTRFKDGHVPHNTGGELSEDTKNKISNTLKETSHFINHNPNAGDMWTTMVQYEDEVKKIPNFKLLCDDEKIKYNALRVWSKKNLNNNKLHPKYKCKIIKIYKSDD